MASSTLLVLLTILASIHWVTINLNTDGSQRFDITYFTPELDETLRVGFTANLDNALTNDRVASLICMRADDATFTIADGTSANGFGVQFSCDSTTCSDTSSPDAALHGGFVSYSSNVYTWTPITDISSTHIENTGSPIALTGTFGLRADSELLSNIPVLNSQAFLRCWAQYNVDTSDASVDGNPSDVSAWNVGTASIQISNTQLSSYAAFVSSNDSFNIGIKPLLSLALVSLLLIF